MMGYQQGELNLRGGGMVLGGVGGGVWGGIGGGGGGTMRSYPFVSCDALLMSFSDNHHITNKCYYICSSHLITRWV